MSQPPAESAPPSEGAATSPEASPEPTPSPADAAPSPAGPSAPDGRAPEEEGSNTTFLILGVLVVILAVVLAIQVPAIQTKLRLRKLQTGLAKPTPSVDEGALEALRAEGPDLLTHLADELEAGGAERERFRILLIGKLLAPMKGEEATQVLIALAADKSPAVRANVYDQLAERTQAGLMDSKLALETLAACWHKEEDEVAKACAAGASVRLGDSRATWPLIYSIRHIPPHGAHLVPNLVESLKVALGPTIRLDLEASPKEAMRQMLAIEATYQEQGGKIPPGQDLKSVLEKRAASASGGAGQ